MTNIKLLNDTNRRDFLTHSAGFAAGFAWRPSRKLQRDDETLIIRNDRPLNAETPVHLLNSEFTDSWLFFVRNHFGPPAVELRPWSVGISGLVTRPRSYSIEDLNARPLVKRTAVLQCAGNGRAFFEPAVGGVQWEYGAVGNAFWGGVRLRDLLEAAGVAAEAKHVHILGGDPPPHPKTPAFLRSIPIERAMDPSTMLATEMNGERLPVLHGGPIRLVVPGWTGNHWIKWVRAIVASTEEAPGFYQRTGYRMPKAPVPPGADVPPDDLVPVTTMNVKSLITAPRAGSSVDAGALFIQGVAWSGGRPIERVEISIDDGAWADVVLYSSLGPYGWNRWHYRWPAVPGKHRIRARATEKGGETQPERTPWNKSGYLWNGYHEVAFTVT